MKINYCSIFSRIESSKIKPVINEGLSYNEETFKEIKKLLPKNIKVEGFSSIQKVPFSSYGKLTKPIFEKKNTIDNGIAKLLLRGWFQKHQNLKSIIESELIESGYMVSEPKFIDELIELNPLKKQDLYITADAVNFFRPRGQKIDGFDEVETTLMAALFGWMALSEDILEKEALSEKCDINISENVNESHIVIDEPIALINEVKQKSEEEILPEKISGSIFEELERAFKNESKFLLTLSDELENGILPDIEILNSRITELTKKFNSVKKSIDTLNQLQTCSLANLKNYYSILQQKERELSQKKALIIDILAKILRLSVKKGKIPTWFNELFLLVEKYKLALNTPNFNEEEWYKEIIDDNHLFNLVISAIELVNTEDPDFSTLDFLLAGIKNSFNIYKFDFYEQIAAQINRNNLIFSEIDGTAPFPEMLEIKSIVPPDPPENSKIEVELPLQVIANVQIQDPEVIDIGFLDSTIPDPINQQNDDGEPEAEDELNDTVDYQVEDAELNLSEIRDQKEELPVVEIPLESAPTTEAIPELAKLSPEIERNKEDNNILKLLSRDEPELAYHLAKCYETQNKTLFLSSSLLANLFLSLKIRTATGPIASMIEANIENYDMNFSATDNGYFKNHLIFASILRPGIFAFNSSGAGIILEDVHPGKMSELSELKNLILGFMSQFDGALNFEILSHIFSEAELRVQKDGFLIKLINWIERAQLAKFRGQPKHYYTVAFANWIRTEGWLHKVLIQFIQKKDIKIIEKLMSEELEESIWWKKFVKELKIVDEYGKNSLDNSDAVRWIKREIESLKELLSEGVECFAKSDQIITLNHKNEVIEFIQELKKEIVRVITSLDSGKEDSQYSKISNIYLIRALQNLSEVLHGKENGQQLNIVDHIIYAPLLKIPYYESGISWEPKQYDQNLINSILTYLSSDPVSTKEICLTHAKNGNIQAFNRLSSIMNNEDIADISNQGLDDFKGKFEFEVRKTKMAVERGCAYGYLSGDLRTKLISSLEELSVNQTNNESGINYPLGKFQINQILSELESSRKNIIAEQEKLISKDFKTNEIEALKSYLLKGNILVFNETIERIKNGQFETVEESFGLLKHYFQNFLSNPNGNRSELILKSIHDRKLLYGIDFSSISDMQTKEAEILMKKWYFLKNTTLKNNAEDFNELKVILERIGFISAELFEKATKRRRSVYYDFKCNPINGKSQSPIPQFGSIAKGSYRLICIKERLTEEDLIEEIKELSPETDRGVIIFNFCWMDQKSRIEMAKLSKKFRITFLMLDEAMLIYLCGIRGSKLPAFIKLATPFTFVEPYQTSSSNLPEEMFYGRGHQIQKLKNITGDFSCLIYGGRQLGKTVLQREVQRVFHNPEIKNYAIYIDLRDSGIGSWNPIEDITSVLIENLKFIPGLVPDKLPNIKLETLLSKFKEWFDQNQESRIILFLDESDRFLEQDAKNEWRHILPLKGLMEKTTNRFKIILAGLHDVRRTNSIPNNPLAHFGNPICIGPMLEKEEAHEAQMLIKTPMEALGYEFESEDLVLTILSHCNWYPSLIQIFCSRLLSVLYEKRSFAQLPIIVTDKDITKAYDKSKDLIKEKFSLTLSLDERYNLLANIIAGETIDNPAIQAKGLSVEDITELAIITWPDGFDSTNQQIEVRNFLEEMVDLGVLRQADKDSYALRTPNLKDLIGTRKQIKDNLNQKVRTRPQEFVRQISRIIYNPTGKREQRSPFPAFYYDKILGTENNVLIFRGSKIGGIDHVEEFLKSRKKDVQLIYPDLTSDNCINFESLWESLEKKRIQGKNCIIFFNPTISYSLEDIYLVKDKIAKKAKLSALFLMGPDQIWNILSLNDNSFDKLESQNIQLVCIPQWKEAIAQEWFKETGCVNAHIPDIFETTGNWHSLLDTYHEKILNAPERWKELLIEFETEIFDRKLKLLAEIGLCEPVAIKMIQELIEWDGGISKQEFISEYQGTENPAMTKNYLEYFLCLNLITNELKANNVVKKLLNHV